MILPTISIPSLPGRDSGSDPSATSCGREERVHSQLLVQTPPEQLDKWRPIFDRLYSLGKLGAFYTDIFQRLPTLMQSQNICSGMTTIAFAEERYVEMFFSLARKNSITYYSQAEFEQVLTLFVAVLSNPEARSHALSAVDVPSFDQGGKALLLSWTIQPRLRAPVNPDPRVEGQLGRGALDGPPSNKRVDLSDRLSMGAKQCFAGAAFFSGTC